MKSGSAAFFLLCIPLLFANAHPQESLLKKRKKKKDPERILYLMRHAKSDKTDTALADFYRPLEQRGINDAQSAGKYLKENAKIELVVASPSVRTYHTAILVCNEIGYDTTKIIWDSTIYRCNYDQLLAAIKKTDDKFKHVLVIAHNPAITDVANLLQSKQQFTEVSTAGVVAVQMNYATWNINFSRDNPLLFYFNP